MDVDAGVGLHILRDISICQHQCKCRHNLDINVDAGAHVIVDADSDII